MDLTPYEHDLYRRALECEKLLRDNDSLAGDVFSLVTSSSYPPRIRRIIPSGGSVVSGSFIQPSLRRVVRATDRVFDTGSFAPTVTSVHSSAYSGTGGSQRSFSVPPESVIYDSGGGSIASGSFVSPSLHRVISDTEEVLGHFEDQSTGSVGSSLGAVDGSFYGDYVSASSRGESSAVMFPSDMTRSSFNSGVYHSNPVSVTSISPSLRQSIDRRHRVFTAVNSV